VQLAHPDGRAMRYRVAIAPGRVFALNNYEIRVIGYNLNTSGEAHVMPTPLAVVRPSVNSI